ncbi:hypothetical protein B0G81_3849 [Paraburkholderia sp. BL6665CI2N2]|uniref:hypothetical protein n=1 Tax=Paraburkholderia sp. BL6665CI2N2 TaxID=1938806 RepID=UPI0010F26CA1|nr:hypothetical protein [Paraburkholderia sp. BL6665CI2N2]TDY23477.1 hypothetical protein B0G81_3849 [Paraburkholderia sp. BL6665CI2N2]
MNSRNMRRWTTVALSAACLWGAFGAAQAQNGKVRIAVVTPLTGPLTFVCVSNECVKVHVH